MAHDMTRKLDDQSRNEYCYKIAVSLCLFADIIFCPIYGRSVVDFAAESEQRWLENTRVFCQREQLRYTFHIQFDFYMKYLTLNDLRHFDKINLLFKGDENDLSWLEYIIYLFIYWNT
jgi:hypothetical protein